MTESNQIFTGRNIFPIRSETACLLKWSWSTIWMQTGTTSSCHRTRQDPIDPDNFDEFHNLESKIKARELMKQGQWPGRGCEYCAEIEKQGGFSDRMMSLNRHHTMDKIPPELYQDSGAVAVTPTILEVYFNNTCNLKCVYCHPSLSSKINDEIGRHGEITIDEFRVRKFLGQNDRYEKMVEDLWNYLDKDDRYKTIRHFHLLGGEPLLQSEIDRSIEFWAAHPNPSLTINLVTNLALPFERFKNKIEKFRMLVDRECIYTLEITASIDCWGAAQEYTRYPLDLVTWEKNFAYLVEQPWLRLAMHSCLNSLSIKSMKPLFLKVNEWNQRRDQKIDYSYDLVVSKQWNYVGMHPGVFGPGVFDEDFDHLLAIMPSSDHNQIVVRQQMQSTADYIRNSTRDPVKITRLKNYLSELDRRRGTDWTVIFPWLVEL